MLVQTRLDERDSKKSHLPLDSNIATRFAIIALTSPSSSGTSTGSWEITFKLVL
jgi:hypothetical protein